METKFIDIHTHQVSAAEDVWSVVSFDPTVDEALPAGFYTVGIHPWNWNSDTVTAPTSCMDHPGLFGIGEIGLDKVRNNENFEWQKNGFREQARMARERNLPVVIHCVKAYDEVISVLLGEKFPTAIFHGFTGSSELARRILDNGWYLSAGSRSLRSERTRKVLMNVPLENLFLETDDEDSDIRNLYREISRLRGEPLEIIKEIIYHNFQKIKPDVVFLA